MLRALASWSPKGPFQVCTMIAFMSLNESVEFSERHGRMIGNEEVRWAVTI
jgi:hypothetical protein